MGKTYRREKRWATSKVKKSKAKSRKKPPVNRKVSSYEDFVNDFEGFEKFRKK